MTRLEFLQRRDAEEGHRARELGAQDVDRLVDARATTGHQAVEVRAADEGELRPQRDRCDDVRAVHDARVDHDRGVLADLAHHLREQVERDGRAVQLTAAVVGEHDAVYPEVDELLGVRDVLHALDDDLPRPDLPDDLEIFVADGRIHRGVEQFADGPSRRRERRELQLGCREEVDPPPRAGDGVEDRADRQLRGDRESVALVSQARAGDGRVDREHERVEARFGGTAHEAVGDVAVAHDVELEPVAPGGVGGLDVFDRGRAERRQRERDAGGPGSAGPRRLALRLHETREAGRRDAERQRARSPEHLCRGVDVLGGAQHVGMELDVLERLTRSRQRQLPLGGAVGVVVGGFRRAPLRDALEVVDREGTLETTPGGIQLGLLELHEFEELGGLGQLTLDHGFLFLLRWTISGRAPRGRSSRRCAR